MNEKMTIQCRHGKDIIFNVVKKQGYKELTQIENACEIGCYCDE